MYHPKHKKTLMERLNNSIIDDELSSIDVFLYMSYFDEYELRWIKANDSKYKPLEYYEDEVCIIPILVLIILLAVVIWLCYTISIPNVN